ncbi:MAG: hypothetical protein L6R40_004772 [Gallowayella cf. fulva]|nr:MAG: hypothetical protein L6R40_004772 [Xanthomendoza cf. fulva]
MNGSQHSGSSSASDSGPTRPSKRPRLAFGDSSTPPSQAEPRYAPDDASSIVQSPERDQENDNPEASKAKRPKYRIHIPSNPRMPEVAFLTQPPSRSPSPYLIDKFYWQKPRRSQSPTVSAAKAQLSGPTSQTQSPRSVRASTRPVTDEATPHVTNMARNASPTVKRSPISETMAQFRETTPVVATSPAHTTSAVFDGHYDDVLNDLPSDAFSSPEPPKVRPNEPVIIMSQDVFPQTWPSQVEQNTRLVAPLANLRQTTLFGTQAQETDSRPQPARKHNWPMANKEEPPTHHKINRKAMETWVYPTNLGKIREYQYSIVARGLYHNMLVALPTGLGKTFIAATIMLNWFRWTTESQIVFVAPTKPLVSQQVKACFEIAGIPRSVTTMLTGATPPGIRAEEWLNKRVFFMTPQTILNDLKTGICDPKRLVLLVVDEAHRATGGYAYVEVVQFLRRFNTSFRVLALTATPGASVEGVQEVIDGLGISRIEIRTEESLDIREYVYSRKVETVLFEPNDEMLMIMDLFAKALQPLVDKLCGMNAYWGKDSMTLTAYGCTQARSKWMSEAGRKASFPIKGMVNTIFSLLASLAHGIELLKFHGIGPFYHKVRAFRDAIDEAGGKVSKYRKQINDSEAFRTMMSRVQVWINNPDFVGHPKLEYLRRVTLNHFLDAGEGRGATAPSGTRIMVFAHYRDSAEEIARVLKRNEPMIRPRVFVGQANSKGSEGMGQKTQLDVIQKFKNGIYNTLVATSIGEEGLDIGEVDLIVCYDASASPIRMLQRMGRTGRKRAGNIVVTLMKGKEENNFIKAKDNYERMQREIAAGTRFDFRDDQSQRIVPRDIQPIVDKRIVDIPFENTQADLPEPKKRAKTPKRPPKKFHMPDGVRKGFTTASRLDGSDSSNMDDTNRPQHQEESPEPLPDLSDALLSAGDQRELERRYLDVQGDSPSFVEVPRVDAFPVLQREHRPVKKVQHGQATRRAVNALKLMHGFATGDNNYNDFEKCLHQEDRRLGLLQVQKRGRSKHASTDYRLSVPQSTESAAEDVAARRSVAGSANNRSSYGLSSTHESVYSMQSAAVADSLTRLSQTETSPQSELMDAKDGSGSEGDLPDFSTLIKIPNTATVAMDGGPSRAVATQPKRRKGRKAVVYDDSDEE